jgi:pyridoxamine 5'-phosphate oxidase
VELLPEILPESPLKLFELWLKEATQEAQRPNPNSMSLATVSADGKPSVRIVLCKELQVNPGYIVYYTNYHSAKALDTDQNPNVSICMHWDRKGRQVRAEGVIVKSPATESDRYFLSRDRNSRIGAWASNQSSLAASRQALEGQFDDTRKKFLDKEVLRPANWGGYRLWFTSVELWINQESRLHERARWERDLEINHSHSNPNIIAGDWLTIGRLQP